MYRPQYNPLPQAGTWTQSQQAFFGDNPYQWAQGNEERTLDLNALMQMPSSVPMFQQNPNFTPDFSAFNSYDKAGDSGMQGSEIQQLLQKRDAYNAMDSDAQRLARTTGAGYFNNQDSGRLFQLLNNQSLNVQNQFRDLYGRQLDTHAQTLLNTPGVSGSTKNWAVDTLSNKTFGAMGADNPNLRTQLPEGDNMQSSLHRWGHRGVTPGAQLDSFAGTRDYLMNKLTPYGGWKGFSLGYNSMGMGSGAATPSSFAGDNDNMSWGNYDSDFGNLIKQPGWGSGVGYAQGAHKPRPFANNSLLGSGGNGVTHTGIFGKPTAPNFAGGNGGSWVGSWEKPGYALPNAEWGGVDRWGFSKKGSASGSEATIAGMSPFYDGESGRIEDFKRYANKLLDVWDKGGQMDMMIGGANSPKYFAGLLYKQLEGLRNAGASDGQLLNVWQQGTRGWSQKDSYPVLQALGINSSAPMGYASPGLGRAPAPDLKYGVNNGRYHVNDWSQPALPFAPPLGPQANLGPSNYLASADTGLNRGMSVGTVGGDVFSQGQGSSQWQPKIDPQTPRDPNFYRNPHFVPWYTPINPFTAGQIAATLG